MSNVGFGKILQPSPYYDVSKERERNRRIEELINQKLDKEARPAWGGIPTAVHEGASVSFSCNNGVDTLLTLNTVQRTEPDFFDATNTDIEPVYTGWVELKYKLRNAASAGVSTPITVTVKVFKAAVLIDSITQRVDLNDLYDLNGSFILECTPGDAITLKIAHSRASAITFDLTNSYVACCVLTASPKLLEIYRL